MSEFAEEPQNIPDNGEAAAVGGVRGSCTLQLNLCTIQIDDTVKRSKTQ